ncbi:MAG: phenylalanine--tRNA ligase subunit beta, partial [Candidatus Eremiobacteraeota bacterium]|nr:phenylalanine--tRNA ligase subunit beta [Candidatus Eremiobacteraeota bacterium]
MKVPIGWLRDFVDLPAGTQAIADRLAEIGFPVDEIIKRPALSGIVIGRIATLERHPNADRLLVASVDVGNQRRLNIATAATNVAVDQTIAVATIGAHLPNLTIERRKMRGFESEGMMISADELALPAEWFEDGILQLNGDARLGEDVAQWLQLSDDVLDVDITTNRPDAMSIFGLARELAAAYRTPLRSPSGMQAVLPAGHDPQGIKVSLKSKDCTRFISQRFSAVQIGVAPLWMRVRLALAGQRPINNVVDVSNYVMLEVGQPLHFYDAAKIKGQHLIARDAEAGEPLTTLDSSHYKLSPRDLVIADDAGAQGLAGLKGGQKTEVTDTTTSIVLEAANFTGARIRRMSAALGLRTEASARHEKGLAPILTDFGATRAATLL